MSNLGRKQEKPKIQGFILSVCLAALLPNAAIAADLWVDRNSIGGPCNDYRHRSQVTESTPWCTLVATSYTVQPGDVVHVREGVYTEVAGYRSVLETSISGTAEAPIKFMAEPGETVVLSGNGPADRGIQFADWSASGNGPYYLEVSGFIVRDFRETGVNLVSVGNVVVRGLEVTNNHLGAIGARDSYNITIEGCDIHHNPMEGWISAISLFRDWGNNVIRGNRIWANTDEDYRETEGHGIILDYCLQNSTHLIENNVIWDNEGWCVSILVSDGGTVRNNTCYQNSLGRYDGTGEMHIYGAQANVHNNIFVSRGLGPALNIRNMPPAALATVHVDGNVMSSPDPASIISWPPYYTGSFAQYQQTNSGGWGANSLEADPQLVDPDNADFDLQEGSPAVDAGLNSESAEIDYYGSPRPFDADGDGTAEVDMGAHEFLIGSIFVSSFEGGLMNDWFVVVE